MYGWGSRTRTYEWRDQNPLPYQLGYTPIFYFLSDVAYTCSDFFNFCNSGERFTPFATKLCQAAGNLA